MLTVVVLSSVLVDETADNANDLYIRSVCFSPDGKLLATGAEDKTIRVRPSTRAPPLLFPQINNAQT